MKKIILPIVAFVLVSCETPSSNVSNPDLSKVVNDNSVYDANLTQVGFGAFKTTAKKEVKGWFKEFTIKGLVDTNQLELVFANASFDILVNSLETNDEGRNQRLLSEFFGNTSSNESITGKVLSFNKDSALVNVELMFNGVKKEVPFKYAMIADTLKLNASINVLDYNSSKALTALNKACESLHKGDDGISKTWPDVNLYLNTVLKSNLLAK